MKQLAASMAAAGNSLGQSTNRQATLKGKSMAGKTLLSSVKSAKYADWSQEEIDPPLCLSVRLSGHSFAPGSQPFIPMIKMSSSKLAFPPCSPNESVY